VGVVVVTHNSAEVIGCCLNSCSEFDVVVVDNASEDDTLGQIKARPRVRVIRNNSNRGFAAAVNQGVEAQQHEFILVLNPDVELLGSIAPLAEACRQPAIAIASGKLVDDRGQPQIGFYARAFPTALTLIFEVLGINRLWRHNPVNRRYRYLDANPDKPSIVEQPAGAFLFFRRSLWTDLGGFDERFHPVWYEDVDFCKRASNQGFHAAYVPLVIARHLGAHSILKLDRGSRDVYWYASLLRYASKHFHPWAFRGVSAAVVLGATLRLVGGVVSRRSFKQVAGYAKAGRMAALSLVNGRLPEPPGGSTTVAG